MFQKCWVALIIAPQPTIAFFTLSGSRASTNMAFALSPPWVVATARACSSL